MKTDYKYAGPSSCLQNGDNITLGLSPDLSREEKVSFEGKLKNPLIFRDAILMLREIVITSSAKKEKNRKEFFEWLEIEIEKRILSHEKYVPETRKTLQDEMNILKNKIFEKDLEIEELYKIKDSLQSQLNKYDFWSDFHKIERKFWAYLLIRDRTLWFLLDPVITVHPDQISFEAFSIDESVYGCLSIDIEEFELSKPPKLGTTNIDFSSKLAVEIERFRTYSNVLFSVNPEGFSVESGVLPSHIEKKIDLPESWIKGFNQVSSAATLNGISFEISPVDMYDICSFLRRHKANKSPRYIKWILEKNKPIKILFEPFKKVLILSTIYTGEKYREEKVWGSRRWLVLEKLIPIAKSFSIKLLGFGMPQFIVADLNKIKMTIGFSSWSSNDWVKGTAFNILSGYIGEGNYKDVYSLLKEKRFLSLEDIYSNFNSISKSNVLAGVGELFKRGEAYFDLNKKVVRFRKLCNEPIPIELYKTTEKEYEVASLIDAGLENFSIKLDTNNECVFSNHYKQKNINYRNYKFYGKSEFDKQYNDIETKISIDEDGQLSKLSCTCRDFKKSKKNLSDPCCHILSLYVVSTKFARLNLKNDKEYKINDIMEMLL